VFLKSFFKKKAAAATDLSWLGTDIHSHLLPGIDDGAPDLPASLELLKGLADLGFKKVVTTPHVFWEMYPNTTETIGEKEALVKNAAAEAEIDVAFSAAAEYFIDDHFAQHIAGKKPLRTLHDNLVLVEFSMLTAPMELQDVLFQMQLQGYQPLIAHPERYTYLNRQPQFFDTLKNSGCLFQLNLLSLTPHYGTAVQALAEYLLKNNMYDYAGTDLHGQKHLQALQSLGASPLYARLRDAAQLKNPLL
jgi:tyrosine-protein phosphatase YwqE